ncbi:MAG: DMT family transporter [Desulfobacteraceae bacterium]|nr:MAG: DMT family transporter [Desulfobacteraceae bacterium]
MQATHTTARFAIIGLISAFLFGAATPASKALLGGIPAQALAGLLYLGAALGVLPIIVKEGAFPWPWRAGHRSFFLLTGAILLGGILGPVLLLLGLKAARAGSVSLWLNLEFVATVVLGHFVFREYLTLRGWIAAGGTFAAILLLAGADRGSGILPTVLVASGCICWGFDNHFTALIDGISPAQTTLWKGVVAGAFNLSIGSAVSGGAGTPGMVLTALLVGTLSYGFSITLYINAAQGMGATRSQMIFSTAPFFGLLLSVTALGEAFTGMQATAAGLMAVSLLVLFSEKHEHVHRHDTMSHQHVHRHDEAHHDHAHEGIRPEQKHPHWHEHDSQKHAHKHWPDLHHRHGHKDEEKH